MSLASLSKLPPAERERWRRRQRQIVWRRFLWRFMPLEVIALIVGGSLIGYAVAVQPPPLWAAPLGRLTIIAIVSMIAGGLAWMSAAEGLDAVLDREMRGLPAPPALSLLRDGMRTLREGSWARWLRGGSPTTDVPLTRNRSGRFTLPVTLNGTTTLTFTLDPLAGNVSIPRSIAVKLMRDGSLTAQDYVREAVSTQADGRRVPGQLFILRSVTAGGVTAANVECLIGSEGTALLLGQTWLREFKSWKIDDARSVLRLRS